MSAPPDRSLAVALRRCQWALDDVAHDLPAGRVSAQQRAELADLLEQVAALIRPDMPAVVDSGP